MDGDYGGPVDLYKLYKTRGPRQSTTGCSDKTARHAIPPHSSLPTGREGFRTAQPGAGFGPGFIFEDASNDRGVRPCRKAR